MLYAQLGESKVHFKYAHMTANREAYNRFMCTDGIWKYINVDVE